MEEQLPLIPETKVERQTPNLDKVVIKGRPIVWVCALCGTPESETCSHAINDERELVRQRDYNLSRRAMDAALYGTKKRNMPKRVKL